MKKYIVLFGVIVSGLVHAAAETSQSEREKENCGDLAAFILEVMTHEWPRVDSARLVVTSRKFHGHRPQFECAQERLDVDQQDALQDAKRTAEKAQERLGALEFCVKESPEYASNYAVSAARTLLQNLSVARWQQCSDAHNEAVKEGIAYEKAQAKKRRQQEANEARMRKYIAQHGNRKSS
jgi:hypothetical protein